MAHSYTLSKTAPLQGVLHGRNVSVFLLGFIAGIVATFYITKTSKPSAATHDLRIPPSSFLEYQKQVPDGKTPILMNLESS